MMVDPATLPSWGDPVLVSVSIAGADDDDPTLTRDELEIFFDSDRAGANDLWTSRRASTSDPWPAPTPMTDLNSTSVEEHPFVTSDGLRIYFMSERSAERDLYVASRADRDSRWGNIALFDHANTTFEEDMGSISADELVLMFSSKRLGSTDDLFESRRSDPSQPWSTPRFVDELDTQSYERQPHLDDYGVVLYFEVRAIADLNFSRRATPAATWGPASDIVELDGANVEESDPWLSPDLRRMYYTQGTGANTKDIYLTTR